MVATAGQNSVCGLNCHILCVGHEKSNLIKKHGEWRTKTYIKTWCFLAGLFVLPSSRNEREWVAAMVAQKMVFGLHSHRSGVRIKSSNFIEKMVSKSTVTPSKLYVFSPVFLLCRSAVMNARGWQQQRSKRRSVGFNTPDRAYKLKAAI